MSSRSSTKNGSPDGRLQRSVRSRQIILDAIVSLVEEGNLVPTAQQVARRAGVGLRTVFRHFDDMEALFAEMDRKLADANSQFFEGVDRTGPLAERIRAATEQRDQAYEMVKYVILSSQVQMWQSKTLRRNWARKRRELRQDLENWFPEVKKLSESRQAAAEVAMCFETWYHLRYDQRLTHKETVASINEMLCLLFEVDPVLVARPALLYPAAL